MKVFLGNHKCLSKALCNQAQFRIILYQDIRQRKLSHRHLWRSKCHARLSEAYSLCEWATGNRRVCATSRAYCEQAASSARFSVHTLYYMVGCLIDSLIMKCVCGGKQNHFQSEVGSLSLSLAQLAALNDGLRTATPAILHSICLQKNQMALQNPISITSLKLNKASSIMGYGFYQKSKLN